LFQLDPNSASFVIKYIQRMLLNVITDNAIIQQKVNKSAEIDQVQITIPVEYLICFTDLINSVNVISFSLSKSDQIKHILVFINLFFFSLR
jgi:hypothetical protein